MKSVEEDDGRQPNDSEEDDAIENASQSTIAASQEQEEERSQGGGQEEGRSRSQHPKPKNVELRFYAEKPKCSPRGRKYVVVCVHIKGKGMRGALQVAGSVSAHTTLTLRVNIPICDSLRATHASPLG